MTELPSEIDSVLARSGYCCLHGRCEDKLKLLPDKCIDAVVTDPPYGLGKEPDPVKVMSDWVKKGYHEISGKGFMGKEWDAFVPQPNTWKEIYRVLKPGGHVLAFFGTRTYDWGVLSMRFAGFEVRDCLMYCFGSGFPKSLDVSKAIDKKNGTYKPGPVSPNSHNSGQSPSGCYSEGVQKKTLPNPQCNDAKQWDGWGTALKPALEPICLARKPISEKNIAENVLKWGTGGINIDACRVSCNEELSQGSGGLLSHIRDGKDYPYRQGELSAERRYTNKGSTNFAAKPGPRGGSNKGRFPANLIHDGSDEVLELFPNTKSGMMKKGTLRAAQDEAGSVCYGVYGGCATKDDTYADSGSAARFFYCAKASKSERNAGLDKFTPKKKVYNGKSAESSKDMKDLEQRWTTQPSPNNHATVKPLSLMYYLVRLVTPPGGIVLDPFMGSGSTGAAAMVGNNKYKFIGIEMDEYFHEISMARIEYWKKYGKFDNDNNKIITTEKKPVKKLTKKPKSKTLEEFD